MKCALKRMETLKEMCMKYKQSNIIVETKSIKNNAWKKCALKTKVTRWRKTQQQKTMMWEPWNEKKETCSL